MGRNKSKQARRAEQWAKERKMINWDVAWKVLASVFAFAGSMVAVYELVNYFRSDAKTFYSIIFPGLGIIVWFIILFQLFRKQNSYAIPLLAVTLLGGVVGGIGLRSYNQTQEDKVIVLVAQFDGPEERYGLHDQIMEDLLLATRGYNDTVIINGTEVITAGQGSEYARELGKKVKADLVIWAWYRPTENPNITIHFENLSTIRTESFQEGEICTADATHNQLESFEIQKQIGSSTSSLVAFITGILSFNSRDYETAIQRFQQILIKNDLLAFVSYYEVFSYLGDSYNAIGNFEDAISNYSSAIEVNSQNSDIFLARGNVYFALNKYDHAIEDFTKAIEIDPKYACAFNNRGNSYHFSSQDDHAIQDYNAAIEIDPQFVLPYFNRSMTFGILGKSDLQLQDLNKVVELDPQNAIAYYNRGGIYYDFGEYERAIQEYDKAIEIDREFVDAYSNRGSNYFMLQKYDRALKDFNKAIELDPDNSSAYAWRGFIYAEQGQYERAIQDFDKALKLDPSYSWAYQHRGDAYQALGKTTEAEADFKKYEELTGEKP